MIEKLFPDLKIEKVQDIDLKLLQKNGIKGLILDIDNTLVPNHVKEADENAIRWISRVKQEGLKVCIVSNASRKRVIKFNEKLKLFAIHRASKPGTKAFKKAIRLMDIQNTQAAVIGDQIFTDIFGGNRADMYTILVTPIHKNESLFIKLKRIPEKFVLKRYAKYLQKKEAGNKV